MPEQWSQQELQEYLKSGKTPSDRTARAAADLECPPRDAPVEAKESPRHPSRVSITIHSYRKRLADPDGISAKAAIDGLVMCGILVDDSAEYVEEVRFKQTKSKIEKTVIVIEDCEE